MRFEKMQLEADESVLKTVRKHWFVILGELFGTVVVITLPLLLFILVSLFPELIPPSLNISTYTTALTFMTTLWLLFGVMAGFMVWTHYYLDLWIITDRRIIVIDQIHFFNRNVSSFRLERLQDIKVVVDGVLPTFLDFGTLHVHTAGNQEENFTTPGLPDPRGLQAIIQNATEKRVQSISISPLLTP
jgi:hypothetical protein